MSINPSPNPAEALLLRAHPSETATTILRERIKQRPLLLRPSSPDPNRDARAARQHARHLKTKTARKSKKPRPFSASQKRSLGLHDLPALQRKYALYMPLHAMWCAYMREILGVGLGEGARVWIDPAGAGPLLAAADYHGALMEVVRSRCVSRVGVRGVVVRDNKFTFEVVTERDEVKVLPKEHTTFRFEVPFEGHGEEKGEKTEEEGGEKGRRKPLVFELHGSRFLSSAPERARRKVKMHLDHDI